MRRRWAQPECPHRRDDFELIRGGRNGVWWQASDGMQVQVAAPEKEAREAVERGRLSLLGVLLAMIAGGRARV